MLSPIKYSDLLPPARLYAKHIYLGMWRVIMLYGCPLSLFLMHNLRTKFRYERIVLFLSADRDVYAWCPVPT